MDQYLSSHNQDFGILKMVNEVATECSIIEDTPGGVYMIEGQVSLISVIIENSAYINNYFNLMTLRHVGLFVNKSTFTQAPVSEYFT
jgi:hypothetical protein